MPLRATLTDVIHEVEQMKTSDDIHVHGFGKTIFASTNTNIGASVHNIWLQIDKAKRRKRQANTADVFLATNASFFRLKERRGEWHLITKACLYDGLNETLQFAIAESLEPYKYCGLQDLVLNVVATPTKPVVLDTMETSGVKVDLGDCKSHYVLEVHIISFRNQGNCVSFICYIACINSDKAFWIENGSVIATTIDSIDFQISYVLEVTCAESKIYLEHPIYREQMSVEVTFTNYSSCIQQWGLSSRFTITPLSSDDTVSTFLPRTQSTTDKNKILPATLPQKDNLTTTLLEFVPSTDKLTTTLPVSFLPLAYPTFTLATDNLITTVATTLSPSESLTSTFTVTFPTMTDLNASLTNSLSLKNKNETKLESSNKTLLSFAVIISGGLVLFVLFLVCLCTFCCYRFFGGLVAPMTTQREDNHGGTTTVPINQV